MFKCFLGSKPYDKMGNMFLWYILLGTKPLNNHISVFPFSKTWVFSPFPLGAEVSEAFLAKTDRLLSLERRLFNRKPAEQQELWQPKHGRLTRVKRSGSQRDASERWEVEHLSVFTRPATQQQSFHLTHSLTVQVCVQLCVCCTAGEDIKEDHKICILMQPAWSGLTLLLKIWF